ncbi:MAG: hypothetical protein VXZ35_05995, partial [Pseudomonadota bacterium]|nr:hypothetical protein [Pseudomonadota bacterium]
GLRWWVEPLFLSFVVCFFLFIGGWLSKGFALLGDFIFFARAKKTEAKESAPNQSPALPVPCATRKSMAAAELAFFDY